jgi:hypothetical protein
MVDENGVALDDALKTVSTLQDRAVRAPPPRVFAATHCWGVDRAADKVCGPQNHYRELSCSYLSLATILSQ